MINLTDEEFEAIARDAKRYQWLRAHWHRIEAYTDHDSHAMILAVGEFGGVPADNERLDAEIDAAMKEPR
jgi:hypothetical protein